MRTVLNSVVRWLGFSATLTRTSRHPILHRVVRIEALEGRSLLSASPISGDVAASSPATEVAPLIASVVPSAAPGEGFVIALYRDVLDRAPDTNGLNFFTNMLTNSATPSDIVSLIWESAEHRGIQIDSYYTTFLERPADSFGRQTWIKRMLDGMTEETVIGSFLTSPEFQILNPLNAPFVTALYNEVLDRAPDTPGLTIFVTVLGNGTATPVGVVQSFLGSREYHLLVVNSFYTDFLQRAPDTAGQAYWVQKLDQNLLDAQFIAETFLSSQEYINLHPLF